MKGIAGHMGLLKLAGLLVLLPLLVWSWGIRRTVDLHRAVHEQALRIESAQADTARPAPLPGTPAEARAESGNTVKTGAILHRIAPALERYGVMAERYTPYRIHHEGESELYAGELLLSAGFVPLTRLLDELEKQSGDRIVSVVYRTVVHPQTRRKQLQMTVIFQQVTQTEIP